MTRPPTMPRDPKPALTPKLRFPEFRDKPAWEETILGSVLTEHGETDDGSSAVHSVSVHKGVINQVEHLGRNFAAADRSNYNLAKPHDVIYTKSPTGDFPWGVVKQNRLPYNVIVSPLYGVFSPVNRHLGYIVHAYFESPIRTTNYLAPITQKGAKNTIQISNATFLSKGLYLPSIEAEHKKIVECLSSLDELIGTESQKLDALKAHKKGLMQQLFPREGETLPRIRFPEFQFAPEWKESPLSKFILSLDAGVSVNSGDRPAAEGELGVLKTSAVTNGVFEPSENKVVSSELEQARLAEPVFADTIIISRMNTPLLVGANAYVAASANNLFLPDRLWAAKPRENVSMRFLAFVLGSDKGRAALATLATGTSGSMKNITKPDVLKLPIMAPSPAEQHRIATCLSSLNDLIAAQSDRLAALQTHKQGLMQQLFPSPEEVEA